MTKKEAQVMEIGQKVVMIEDDTYVKKGMTGRFAGFYFKAWKESEYYNAPAIVFDKEFKGGHDFFNGQEDDKRAKGAWVIAKNMEIFKETK